MSIPDSTTSLSLVSLFLGGVTIGLGIAIGTTFGKSLVKTFRRWSGGGNNNNNAHEDDDVESAVGEESYKEV